MIKTLVKRLLLWCGLQTYINGLKKNLLEKTRLVDKVAGTLRDTLEMRDTWRTTAIETTKEREYWKKRYEKAADEASKLIRFDLYRASGVTQIYRKEEGEYVKWRALAGIFQIQEKGQL